MIRFSILAVAISFIFFPVSAETGKLLWAKATSWGGEVRVRELGKTRILFFADRDGETEESRMLLSDPDEPQSSYLKQMVAAAAWWHSQRPAGAEAPSCFVVGLGGGGLSKALARLFPQGSVTSAEIEPAVVEAAQKYFFYQESRRMVTVVDDARHFFETSSEEYDLIFLDAFDDDGVPEPLRTVEFASILDQHLNPGGAVIANIHLVPEEPSLRYQRSLMEVLPHCYLTKGVAQGVGVFSHSPLFPGEGVQGHLPTLLPPGPQRDLEGVTPYHDKQP